MPPKKNVKIEKKVEKKKEDIVEVKKDDKEYDENDDNQSDTTDSDIISGTFSQLEDNEEEVAVESDIESEEEIEDEIEEAEEAEEEVEADEETEEKVKVPRKKAVKKAVVVKNDCLYNNIDFEEDYDEKEEQVDNNSRLSSSRLTKYERVRIIGIRAKQIMMGANILVKGVENKTPTEIAELELKHNMVPFKIKRKLPNGKFEIWKLSELEK